MWMYSIHSMYENSLFTWPGRAAFSEQWNTFRISHVPNNMEALVKKPISPRTHGIIDYATVLTVAAAPKMLDLPDSAAKLCYGLAAGYLGLSMLTDYPLSAKRVVPFKAHGAAEAAIGLALPAMPWVMGFEDDRAACALFFGLTAITGVVAALTDWEGEKRQVKAKRRAPRIHKVA
jgi:hypothetical protein